MVTPTPGYLSRRKPEVPRLGPQVHLLNKTDGTVNLKSYRATRKQVLHRAKPYRATRKQVLHRAGCFTLGLPLKTVLPIANSLNPLGVSNGSKLFDTQKTFSLTLSDIEALYILKQKRNLADTNLFGGLRVSIGNGILT